jgi:hypothetical protein
VKPCDGENPVAVMAAAMHLPTAVDRGGPATRVLFTCPSGATTVLTLMIPRDEGAARAQRATRSRLAYIPGRAGARSGDAGIASNSRMIAPTRSSSSRPSSLGHTGGAGIGAISSGVRTDCWATGGGRLHVERVPTTVARPSTGTATHNPTFTIRARRRRLACRRRSLAARSARTTSSSRPRPPTFTSS